MFIFCVTINSTNMLNIINILRALFFTLFIFSFAGWVYIAMNAVFHPTTLTLPLTHLLPYPREDTFGIACFGVSIVSCFFWSLLQNRMRG